MFRGHSSTFAMNQILLLVSISELMKRYSPRMHTVYILETVAVCIQAKFTCLLPTGNFNYLFTLLNFTDMCFTLSVRTWCSSFKREGHNYTNRR